MTHGGVIVCLFTFYVPIGEFTLPPTLNVLYAIGLRLGPTDRSPPPSGAAALVPVRDQTVFPRPGRTFLLCPPAGDRSAVYRQRLYRTPGRGPPIACRPRPGRSLRSPPGTRQCSPVRGECFLHVPRPGTSVRCRYLPPARGLKGPRPGPADQLLPPAGASMPTYARSRLPPSPPGEESISFSSFFFLLSPGRGQAVDSPGRGSGGFPPGRRTPFFLSFFFSLFSLSLIDCSKLID